MDWVPSDLQPEGQSCLRDVELTPHEVRRARSQHRPRWEIHRCLLSIPRGVGCFLSRTRPIAHPNSSTHRRRAHLSAIWWSVRCGEASTRLFLLPPDAIPDLRNQPSQSEMTLERDRSAHFRNWHQTDMPKQSSHVRCWGRAEAIADFQDDRF
jgi:hypothetical protein